jgi:hypothetical protein
MMSLETFKPAKPNCLMSQANLRQPGVSTEMGTEIGAGVGCCEEFVRSSLLQSWMLKRP